MGNLDHVHIRVPDREVAAAWYAEHLGFEPVPEYDFWATGVPGGPLQISADGGRTMLALFEAGHGHRSLPGEINTPHGRALAPDDVIDFDLCWAFELADPWGNRYELNCYDYDRIRIELIEVDAITPARYWPRELYDGHRDR